jgi:hypothetical protein
MVEVAPAIVIVKILVEFANLMFLSLGKDGVPATRIHRIDAVQII